MAGPWSCQQTGDCCRLVEWVAVMPEELVLLKHARPEVELQVRMGGPNGLIAFRAGPCPFLDGNLCSVHAVRPYNCRRWMCGRDAEAHRCGVKPEMVAIPLVVRQSRPLRRQYRNMQAKAQRWALKHGWGRATSWVPEGTSTEAKD